jgi:flavin-dependent dehydrogenase
MRSYDVCVVGGGPAGAFFATLAHRAGRSIVLFNDKRAAKPRIETLSPEAIRLLHEAQLDWCLTASGAIRSTGTTDAWSSRTNRVYRASILNPWGSAWHVDRARFDAALLQAAHDAGVSIIGATIDTVSTRGNEFQVTARDCAVSCHELVDATGAVAHGARLLGIRRTVVDRQLVIYAQLNRMMPEPAFIITSFVEGWCYVSPHGEASTQVAIITDGESLRKHGQCGLLRRALQYMNLDAMPDELHNIRRAPVVLQFVDGPRPTRFATIGDAAWTPDPLSGHGVARALEAALHLASRPTLHAPSLTPLALEHLRLRSQFYAAAPWQSATYYQNRIRACKQAEEVLHGYSMEMGTARL